MNFGGLELPRISREAKKKNRGIWKTNAGREVGLEPIEFGDPLIQGLDSMQKKRGKTKMKETQFFWL